MKKTSFWSSSISRIVLFWPLTFLVAQIRSARPIQLSQLPRFVISFTETELRKQHGLLNRLNRATCATCQPFPKLPKDWVEQDLAPQPPTLGLVPLRHYPTLRPLANIPSL